MNKHINKKELSIRWCEYSISVHRENMQFYANAFILHLNEITQKTVSGFLRTKIYLCYIYMYICSEKEKEGRREEDIHELYIS